MGESVDCSRDHGSPSSRAKLRPSAQGTYSWGIHSCATPRWRLRLASTVGASSSRSTAVSMVRPTTSRAPSDSPGVSGVLGQHHEPRLDPTTERGELARHELRPEQFDEGAVG